MTSFNARGWVSIGPGMAAAEAEAVDVPCAPAAAGVDASGTMLERGYGCERQDQDHGQGQGQGQLPLLLARRLPAPRPLLSRLHRPLLLPFPRDLVSPVTSWRTTGLDSTPRS